MSYKTYEEYKDSSSVWIKKIPKHWELHKIKNLIFFQEGPGLRNWQFTDSGIRVICVTNITEEGIDFSNYEKFISVDEYKQSYTHFTVNKTDLLLSSSGNSWGKVAEYNDDEIVILNTSTIRINKNPSSEYQLKQSYIKWALQSEYIREQLGLMMTGSCQPNFGPTHLAKVSILMPPLDEQTQISNYLDTEITKINAIITKNKNLIELLEEKRIALINNAVTKGLNSTAPMKDSGIDWIGEIPENWSLKKFRYVLTERNEKNNPIKSKERLSLSIDKGVTLYSEKTTNLDRFKDDFTQYKLAYEGDLVLNSMNMIVGAVGVSKYFGCVSPVYYTYYDETDENICTVYCDYLFKTKTIKKFLRSLGRGIMSIDRGDDKINTCRLKVSRDDLRNMIIPCPPLDEQKEINSYLNKECTIIDKTISIVTKHIELLEEYKTSLIHHVTIGKMDVRDEV